MSKATYYPKGWRAGPDKLPRKVFSEETDAAYVAPRPVAPPPAPAPAPAPSP
jgi:hypothetical protein